MRLTKIAEPMIRTNMQLEPLNIRTPAVQQFLWEHLVPADFRHDYTKLDAIKEVERQVYAGNTQLWGNLREDIVFRCEVRNPRVIEPHIMGNGTKIRSALRVGVQKAWSLGFERVAIWTQHESIARIVEKCGFTRNAVLPRMHMDGEGKLLDLFVLTMERPDAL